MSLSQRGKIKLNGIFLTLGFFATIAKIGQLLEFGPVFAISFFLSMVAILLAITAIIFLIIKRGKWNTVSFFRWVGVVLLIRGGSVAVEWVTTKQDELEVLKSHFILTGAECLIAGTFLLLFLPKPNPTSETEKGK